jgi:hypothetical protein
MRVIMHHIALVCAVAISHPNGSCQICCETDTVKVCRFQQKCSKEIEDEKPETESRPNRSNPHEEVSNENE